MALLTAEEIRRIPISYVRILDEYRAICKQVIVEFVFVNSFVLQMRPGLLESYPSVVFIVEEIVFKCFYSFA